LQTQNLKCRNHVDYGHASSEKGGTLNDSKRFQVTSIGCNALYWKTITCSSTSLDPCNNEALFKQNKYTSVLKY